MNSNLYSTYQCIIIININNIISLSMMLVKIYLFSLFYFLFFVNNNNNNNNYCDSDEFPEHVGVSLIVIEIGIKRF